MNNQEYIKYLESVVLGADGGRCQFCERCFHESDLKFDDSKFTCPDCVDQLVAQRYEDTWEAANMDNLRCGRTTTPFELAVNICARPYTAKKESVMGTMEDVIAAMEEAKK